MPIVGSLQHATLQCAGEMQYQLFALEYGTRNQEAEQGRIIGGAESVVEGIVWRQTGIDQHQCFRFPPDAVGSIPPLPSRPATRQARGRVAHSQAAQVASDNGSPSPPHVSGLACACNLPLPGKSRVTTFRAPVPFWNSRGNSPQWRVSRIRPRNSTQVLMVCTSAPRRVPAGGGGWGPSPAICRGRLRRASGNPARRYAGAIPDAVDARRRD